MAYSVYVLHSRYFSVSIIFRAAAMKALSDFFTIGLYVLFVLPTAALLPFRYPSDDGAFLEVERAEASDLACSPPTTVGAVMYSLPSA